MPLTFEVLLAEISVIFLDSSAITSIVALYIVFTLFVSLNTLDWHKLVDGFHAPILDSVHSK